MTSKMKSYKYFYLSRPPCVGTEPDGWTEREGWTPTRLIDLRPAHGFVTYSQKLDPGAIWKYSLRPDDVKEQAEMKFWGEPDVRTNYLALNPKRLHEFRHKDDRAWAALILLDLI